MATLTIDDPVATMLREQATARGMTIEEHLDTLAAVGAAYVPSKPMPSKEAFAALLKELAADSAGIPPLPADFSRADFYDDHE